MAAMYGALLALLLKIPGVVALHAWVSHSFLAPYLGQQSWPLALAQALAAGIAFVSISGFFKRRAVPAPLQLQDDASA